MPLRTVCLVLQDLAKKCASQKVHPLRVKKLYVLAALEIEKFKKRTLDMATPDKAAQSLLNAAGGTATMAATAAQTLAGMPSHAHTCRCKAVEQLLFPCHILSMSPTMFVWRRAFPGDVTSLECFAGRALVSLV